MRKLSVVVTFILSIFILAGAQERNELPMYGGLPPTPRQAQADRELIDAVVRDTGSREKGAQQAVRLGFQYLGRNDWRTAMKRFNQAWLLGGESADVLWGFGAVLSYQGKFADSEKYFIKAVTLASENGRLLNDFGFMYQFRATKGTKNKTEREGYLNKSIEMFERASRLESTDDRIFFNWAISLYFKRDYKGAWEKIKEAERLGGKAIEQKFIRDLSKKMARP